MRYMDDLFRRHTLIQVEFTATDIATTSNFFWGLAEIEALP